MTRGDVLEVVYRFYARGAWSPGSSSSEGYGATKEHRRLVEACRHAIAAYETWTAMLSRLNAYNESLSLLGGWADPAYSAFVVLPGRRTLGFHVSFLGPYYGLRRTGALGEEPAARDIVREIEATYPGHELIPPEIGDEIVPDVALVTIGFGKATVYDCLLSEQWEGSSGPLTNLDPGSLADPDR